MSQINSQLASLVDSIKLFSNKTGSTFDDALKRIADLGTTTQEEITRQGERTLGAGQQDLISSGLSNTTLGPNLRRAVDEDVARQRRGVSEGVGAQQAGILTQRAGFEQQQLALMAQLLQQASAANTQPTSAFVPASSDALNRPNSVFQRPPSAPGPAELGADGGGGAAGTGSRIVTRQTAGLGSARNTVAGAPTDVVRAKLLQQQVKQQPAQPLGNRAQQTRGGGGISPFRVA